MTHPATDPDPADLIRRSQDRDYSAEGIPMLLALVSEAAPIPDPDDAARTAGRGLAERIERDRAVVAPTRRDADLGVTITLLQAAAYADISRSDGAGPPAGTGTP